MATKMTVPDMFQSVSPHLLRRESGGWLAISEPGAAIRIAVIGLTAEDARDRFAGELAEWRRLLSETEGKPEMDVSSP
jgi:hypothetical protein